MALRLFDNTRLQDFRRCARYYFFRHVKHWSRDSGPSAPLAFGGAWHAAMDILWASIAAGKPRDECIEDAFKAFKLFWYLAGMPFEEEMDEDDRKFWSPRLPSTAHEMLWEYHEARQRFIRSVEILEIERPFAVPLTPDDPTLFYVGRIDKIVRVDSRRIRGIEHKTTTATKAIGKETRIRPLFMESFSPNSQVDGYLFALAILYDAPETDVWVDAAMVHATKQDFAFIPVERIGPMLDAWLYTTHKKVQEVEDNNRQLLQDSPNDPYLRAFPQDTRSCFDFNTACPFLPLCKSRANPLTWEEAPPGYKVDRWDPLEHVGTPKELL